jgi:hypothetical protein
MRAVEYGRAQQLFDIPADYRLDVVPTPPVLRSTIDAAYYMAPPFKKAGVGRFYLTPTDNDPAALAQNNRASVADTAIHEGFPGHDWHFKYMGQHAAEISNVRWFTPGSVEDSMSMWQDSPAAEGWGLYSEELMAEPTADRPYGFYSAAEYLYELQGQLLRAVRVRVDTGLHTGRMTYDQAVDYFTEHVSFYPGARAAAATDPTARADGGRRARDLPLLQVADAGGDVQPGEERDHRVTGCLQGKARRRLPGQGLPRALHAHGDDSGGVRAGGGAGVSEERRAMSDLRGPRAGQ